MGALGAKHVILPVSFIALAILGCRSKEYEVHCEDLIPCGEPPDLDCPEIDGGYLDQPICTNIPECTDGPMCATREQACQINCGKDECMLGASFPMYCCDCDYESP
jgi:hypothetical protein